ncbi:MAG: FAD-dependent oxidoreductase [Clostridiales bacterium]|nr:FAD-dependent oxidoreductase [Clostridiales bacterium]
MKNYIFESIKTEIKGEYDVIVCGGGPAGIGAAIAASRNGAKTLLVERYGFLGGMWTAGLINPIFDYANKGGIIEEIIIKLKKRRSFGGFINSCFNYDDIKVILDNMVKEARVLPLYHTWISRPVMDENRVKGIITENKNGRYAYLSKVVIDCTGDGDVAADAGADYKIGRDADGKTQAMTLMFVLGNIKYNQTDAFQVYNLMRRAVDENKLPYKIQYQRPFIIQLPGQDAAVVQLTHIRGLSGLDASDLTEAEIEGRKQVMDTIELFRKYIPQFRNVKLLYTAPQIGIRETRRIIGEYKLSLEDVIEGRQFNDGITTVTSGIDIHEPDTAGQNCIKVKPYQIPYRCLVPKKIDGILTAGRCISGSFEAHASYRVTGDCIAIGQAAGTAAALSIKNNCKVRDINTTKLINLLKAQNVRGC